jgi:hypothetical protein
MISISKDAAVSFSGDSSLKFEAENPSRIFIAFHQTSLCHIPEDSNLGVINFLGIFMWSIGCFGIISAFDYLVIVKTH